MYPLTADTYAKWVAQSHGDVVNVFMDYESFGEHLWPETGIFEFLRHLPFELSAQDVSTILPSKVLADYSPVGSIDVTETISWADIEKDTSAWMGNDRQQAAFRAIESASAYAKDKRVWRYLQTSDHFYYMASKHGSCGEVHSYFCYLEGEDAFKTYMRILADYEERNIRGMKNRKGSKDTTDAVPGKRVSFHLPCRLYRLYRVQPGPVLRAFIHRAQGLYPAPSGAGGFYVLDYGCPWRFRAC
jgi:alpha-amylase